jgi:hypothetical protein
MQRDYRSRLKTFLLRLVLPLRARIPLSYSTPLCLQWPDVPRLPASIVADVRPLLAVAAKAREGSMGLSRTRSVAAIAAFRSKWDKADKADKADTPPPPLSRAPARGGANFANFGACDPPQNRRLCVPIPSRTTTGKIT